MKRIVFEQKVGNTSVALSFEVKESLKEDLENCLTVLSSLREDITQHLETLQ